MEFTFSIYLAYTMIIVYIFIIWFFTDYLQIWKSVVHEYKVNAEC